MAHAEPVRDPKMITCFNERMKAVAIFRLTPLLVELPRKFFMIANPRAMKPRHLDTEIDCRGY